MVAPDVDGDAVWRIFNPAVDDCAWCAVCHELLGQYFYGSGANRRQMRLW